MEMKTATPIDPPICWAVSTIAEATPASWAWTPPVAAFWMGPRTSPSPSPDGWAPLRAARDVRQRATAPTTCRKTPGPLLEDEQDPGAHSAGRSVFLDAGRLPRTDNSALLLRFSEFMLP